MAFITDYYTYKFDVRADVAKGGSVVHYAVDSSVVDLAQGELVGIDTTSGLLKRWLLDGGSGSMLFAGITAESQVQMAGIGVPVTKLGVWTSGVHWLQVPYSGESGSQIAQLYSHGDPVFRAYNNLGNGLPSKVTHVNPGNGVRIVAFT